MTDHHIDPAHLADCRAIAELLLVPGTRVASFDRIRVQDYPDINRRVVSDVFLHVSAEHDVAHSHPTDEEGPLHAAGDCWQEVWQAWPETDPISGNVRIEAIRTV